MGCRARSLYLDREQKKILVGRYDCRLKIIDFTKGKERIVAVAMAQDEKDKIYIQSIRRFGKVYLCHRSDGSLFYFDD